MLSLSTFSSILYFSNFVVTLLLLILSSSSCLSRFSVTLLSFVVSSVGTVVIVVSIGTVSL
ncbi:unnamed protein product [Schistosoma margrebowiei]|uniref:Uncharacterized protein n=1 Tax=Schistosoma margrebowiei TaxID=48269 RepID=A0A3P7X1S4_9TREM|nr:unnamed protein product [Schistosoma margrebowiei]